MPYATSRLDFIFFVSMRDPGAKNRALARTQYVGASFIEIGSYDDRFLRAAKDAVISSLR
jgi:hypothetical protein